LLFDCIGDALGGRDAPKKLDGVFAGADVFGPPFVSAALDDEVFVAPAP